MNICDIRHPMYVARAKDWELWRETYEGGDSFIEHNLRVMSKREEQSDFEDRKAVTYCPAFAKEAVVEIKNSLYQRFNDIERVGGPQSYQDAVLGDFKGVDLLGSSMSSFIGQEILKELLVMSRVGVYVDMPRIEGQTIRDRANKRPYIYPYKTEDILCWCNDNSENPNEFTQLLLREEMTVLDSTYGLPTGCESRYRFMQKVPEGVLVSIFDDEGEMIFDPILLNLPIIPFVLMKIDHSVLTDVARYQIALLNLASADMSYSLRSNFPFFTEQRDPRLQSSHLKGEEGGGKESEKKIGVNQGIRYALGAERPGFIHPSSEPLKISMEKQEQLKVEIRQLVQLSVQALNPNKQASAASKSLDNQGLEAGLSYIGLELERGERRISQFWSLYEGSKSVATVNYPTKYSLKTDAERVNEAETLVKLGSKIPSKTLQKEVHKEAAKILLEIKVPQDVLKQINKEIDDAQCLTSDYEEIASDVMNGLVDKETASLARGYPKGSAEKAKEEHVQRATEIALAQAKAAGARGVADLSANPGTDGSVEKKAAQMGSDLNAVGGDQTRGGGK